MNIKRLLSKSNWTGVEVGKALIYSLAHDFKKQQKAISDPQSRQEQEPLISQADFNRMRESLKTAPQIKSYLVYDAIYNGVIDSFNRCQVMRQQYYHGYYRYFAEFMAVYNTESLERNLGQYPLILTKDQYKKVCDAWRAEKEKETITYRDIFFEHLLDYINEIQTAPAAVLKAIENTKKEPCTNQYIIDNYNYILDIGHYELPDGRRSDEMSKEEWQEALGFYEENDKIEVIDADGNTLHDLRQNARHTQKMEFTKLLFKGDDAILRAMEQTGAAGAAEFTLEDFKKHLLEVIEEKRPVSFLPGENDWIPEELADKSPVWHEETEPPENVTKYDVLYYTELLEEYRWQEELQEDFKKDYPELFKALQQDILAKLGVKKAPAWDKTYTLKDIAAKMPDYINIETPAPGAISQYYYKIGDAVKGKQAANGVSVLVDVTGYMEQEYNKADHAQPKIPFELLQSLDNITVETAEALEIYKRDLMDFSGKWLVAYNFLIEILADVYDIEPLKVTQTELRSFINQAQAYNELLYTFYADVYGQPEDKARKRQLLQDYFVPIEWEDYIPTEQAKQTVRDMLERQGNEAAKELNELEKLINILMGGLANE